MLQAPTWPSSSWCSSSSNLRGVGLSAAATSRSCCICSSTSSFSLAGKDIIAMSRKSGTTLSANGAPFTREVTARWASAGSTRLAPRIFKILLMGFAALVFSQYLAGYFLLWSLHAPPRRATPLTPLRYAVYYGNRPAIAARVVATSAISLVLVGGAFALALGARQR